MIQVILIIIGLALTTSSPVTTKHHFNTTSNGFPKVMWTYWSSGFDSAPFFTKLCLKNRDKMAMENGWTHIFLDESNLKEYLDVNEVQNYYEMPASNHIQMKADLIRLLLMINYGGLWIDSNAYLTRNISWVENPHHPFISNRIG